MEDNNVTSHSSNRGVFPEQGITESAPPIQAQQIQQQVVEKPQQIQPQVGGQPQQIETPQQSQQQTQVNQNTKTYTRLEMINQDGVLSGVIEIDLISFRERGEENRYLSVNTVGANKDGVQSETTLSIDNEADFNKLKKFISELNWND